MRQLAATYRRQWPDFVGRYGRHLPAGALELGKRVGGCIDSVIRGLSRSPVTLVHGDYRADNLYFYFGTGSEHDPLVVADWQLVCRARGAFDVAYLLCQSLESGARAQWEWSILRRWHERLTALGVSAYSFGDAVDDYKRGALLSVVYAVVGASLDRSNNRGTQLARTQALRTFRAALEIRASEVLGTDSAAA